MEQLNYEVLEKSGYQGYVLKTAPEKVLQFGEGNFLRAFVDYWFDLANENVYWFSQLPRGLLISSMNRRGFIPYISEAVRKGKR